MSPQRALRALLAPAAAALCAGCGITNPYEHPNAPRTIGSTTAIATTRPATAAEAQDPVPERGGTIPTADQRAEDHLAPAAGARTAREAVLRYARLYINWNTTTLAADQRRLARLSIGAARLAAEQQTAAARADRTLHNHHLTNHGSVISADPGRGVEHGRWVIVTREQTTGSGSYHKLPYELHLTLATVTHTHQGWVISQWSPQV